MWTHPRPKLTLGAGITDQDRNILANQTLLLRTLSSVHPFLSTGKKRKPGDTGNSEHTATTSLKRKRKTAGSDDEEETTAKDDDGVSDLEDLDEDDLLAEEQLERALRDNSIDVPTPDRQGTILVTLLDQPPYTLWNLPKLATKPPPTTPTETYLPSAPASKGKSKPKAHGHGVIKAQPRYILLRSFAFEPELWDGYAHRRTIGFKEGLSMAQNEEIVGRKGRARTWEFAARDRA